MGLKSKLFALALIPALFVSSFAIPAYASPSVGEGDGLVTQGIFYAAYLKKGGAKKVGSPINLVHYWGNCKIQDFRGGGSDTAIMLVPGAWTAYVVSGAIWWRYKGNDLKGAEGFLGCPTSNEIVITSSTGQRAVKQEFQGGLLVWHDGGLWAWKTFTIYGAIRAKWESIGGPASSLGLPVSDEYEFEGKRRSDFERGYIDWTASAGAKVHEYYIPRNGDLVKDPLRPEVYIVWEGQRHHILNPTVFYSLNRPWSDVKTITAGEIDSIPLGAPIDIPAEGSLIKSASSPKIYFYSKGIKYWIIDPFTYNALGFPWGAKTLYDFQINAIPEGNSINLHDGNLIQGSGPEIYVVERAQKRHIVDWPTFLSLGYKTEDVAHLPDSIIARVANGPDKTSKPKNNITLETLQIGDILLLSNQNDYFNQLFQIYLYGAFYTHVVIYIGIDGATGKHRVIHAANPKEGVQMSYVEDFAQPTAWAIIRPNTSLAIKRAAAKFARKQLGKEYSIPYFKDYSGAVMVFPKIYLGLDKTKQNKFYCSSLVWRSYFSASKGAVDLDVNSLEKKLTMLNLAGKILNVEPGYYVFPDEIYSSVSTGLATHVKAGSL